MSDQGSEFVDQIVQSKLPEHIKPMVLPLTDFKPWHRVRKQFIREHQWNYHVTNVAKRYLRGALQTEEGQWSIESEVIEESIREQEVPEDIRVERPLKCLVIPGDDLLDLRLLWKALEGLKCWIKFLGFNSSMRADRYREQVHSSLNDVFTKSRVFLESQVIPDEFQAIASNTSQAYKLFCDYGPYNVVNLDICDTLLPHGDEEKTRNYYTALHQLITYQLREQTKPWLLFLTTQVDHLTASQVGMNKLGGPTRRNCDTHAEFAERMGGLVPKAAFTGGQHAFDISVLKPENLEQVFGVILGKYFMELLSNATPRWTVHMLSAYRYTVEPQAGIPLLSLAFVFNPQHSPPIDKVGMSNLKPKTGPQPSELEVALKLISVAQKIQDVDRRLREDQALWEATKASSADLLESAGYDREAYLKWVDGGEICAK